MIKDELIKRCEGMGLITNQDGIPKKELVPYAWYIGVCRNAFYAQWIPNLENGTGQFIYIRHKFGGFFIEKIFHFEDENVFDVFIPLGILP